MRADFQLNSAEQVVERDLLRYYAAGEPTPAFVARLEQQLAAPAVTTPAARSTPGLLGRWLAAPRPARWAVVAVALLLVLAVTVGALGPQRVWAEVQRLLGYVPGIGFVDLKDTRVLVAPVQVTRAGITLQVDQVIAEPARTRVVLRTEGLPREDTVIQPGSSMSERDSRFAAALRLPDGSRLESHNYNLRWGAANLDFPPLPAQFYTVTLELAGLPMVPAGIAPENWTVALTLQPALADAAAARYSEPYRPAGASDSHAGLTLTVLQVAQTADETALQVRVAWQDPTLRIASLVGGVSFPVMRDDVGHLYWEKPTTGGGSMAVREVVRVEAPDPKATPTPEPTFYDGMLTFGPASALASRLSVEINDIEANILTHTEFDITIPPGVEVGDAWPLDVDFRVAGLPLHLSSARLVEEEVQVNGRTVARKTLEFAVEGAITQGDTNLRQFFIHSDPPSGPFGAGSVHYPANELEVELAFNPEKPFPSGTIHLIVDRASITIHGPWRLEWNIPGHARTDVRPVTLRPQDAVDTHHGYTLRVIEATHTDRLVQLKADLADPPPGAQLARLAVWDSQSRKQALYVEDERGVRYSDDALHTLWRPGGVAGGTGADPQPGIQELTLPPVSPLAHRVTVSFPGITVLRPGRTSFDVVVPPGIELKEQEGRPPMSESWPMDVSFELGGHTVHYTEASAMAINESVYLMLGPFTGTTAMEGTSVFGFCNMRATGPQGEAVAVLPLLGAGPCATSPAFNIINPVSGSIEPGVYHVEVDGYTEYVPGPWRLSWDVRP